MKLKYLLGFRRSCLGRVACTVQATLKFYERKVFENTHERSSLKNFSLILFLLKIKVFKKKSDPDICKLFFFIMLLGRRN